MISRLARWWLRRKGPAYRFGFRTDDEVIDYIAGQEPEPPDWFATGECVCSRQVAGDDLHRVVALSTDDATLGVDTGGTAMSADFCADHCPGGCRLGCPIVVP